MTAPNTGARAHRGLSFSTLAGPEASRGQSGQTMLQVTALSDS